MFRFIFINALLISLTLCQNPSSNQALNVLVKGSIQEVRSFLAESNLNLVAKYILDEDAYQQSLIKDGDSDDVKLALNDMVAQIKQRHDYQNQLFSSSSGIAISSAQSYVEQKVLNFANDLSTPFATLSSLTREFHHLLQMWTQDRFMGERSSLKKNYVNLVDKIDQHVHFALTSLHNNALNILESTRLELLANGTDIFNMNIRLNLLNQKFAFAFSYAWDLLIVAIANPISSYNYLETALENTKFSIEQLKYYQDSIIITSLTPFISDILSQGVSQMNSTLLRSYYYDFQLLSSTLLIYDYTGNSSTKSSSSSSQNFSFTRSASFSLDQPLLTWQQVKAGNSKFVGKQTFTNYIQELASYNADNINWLLVHPATSVVNNTESLNYFSFYHPASQKYLGATSCLTSSSGFCATTQSLQTDDLNKQLFTFNKEASLTFISNISTDNYYFINFGSNFKLKTNKGFSLSQTQSLSQIEIDYDRCNYTSLTSFSPAAAQDCLLSTQWAFKNVRPSVYIITNRLNGLTLSSINYSNVVLTPLYSQATNGRYQRNLTDGTIITQEWSLLQTPASYFTPNNTFWASSRILTQNYSSSSLGLLRSSFDLDFDLFPLSVGFNPSKSKDVNQRFILTSVDSTPVAMSFQDDKLYTIASWSFPEMLLTANLSDNSIRQSNSTRDRTRNMGWQIFRTSSSASLWRIIYVDWSGDLYCLQATSLNQVALNPCDDSVNEQVWNIDSDPKYAGMAYQIRNQVYSSALLSNPIITPPVDGDTYPTVSLSTNDAQTRFKINPTSY